jgi:hypothetical protein
MRARIRIHSHIGAGNARSLRSCRGTPPCTCAPCAGDGIRILPRFLVANAARVDSRRLHAAALTCMYMRQYWQSNCVSKSKMVHESVFPCREPIFLVEKSQKAETALKKVFKNHLLDFGLVIHTYIHTTYIHTYILHTCTVRHFCGLFNAFVTVFAL